MEPNATDWVERIDQEAKELKEVMHDMFSKEEEQFPREELLKKMGRSEK